ncbi:cell division protein FtsL [Solemya velesiana gill symbiont]|uniref:Cell division protein FtsL n=1 Tax=Solemya velesiana gill symbiont TaxID=1918948 RepID=A0A1T2KWU5_9GAMM|nr:cell division protein FtsL [Solemya velesiana gill symbiont]OOZ37284.1 cell division protein FtsL [Solemya velesiana gill symbiont]
MSRGRFIALVVLIIAVLVSATGVVYAKYSSRKYFVELQLLRTERDAVDVEWGRLQLEQSTWATHGRVERLARKKLKMHIPSSEEVVVIRSGK